MNNRETDKRRSSLNITEPSPLILLHLHTETQSVTTSHEVKALSSRISVEKCEKNLRNQWQGCPVLNVSHNVPIATPTTDNVNHPRHTYFIKELAEVKVNVTLRLIKEGSEY